MQVQTYSCYYIRNISCCYTSRLTLTYLRIKNVLIDEYCFVTKQFNYSNVDNHFNNIPIQYCYYYHYYSCYVDCKKKNNHLVVNGIYLTA